MIVVGVDGSEGANTALEFAAAEAALRGADVRIVSAWELPPAAGYVGDLAPPIDPETWDSLRARAQQVADDALAALKELQPSVKGEALAVQGHPADVVLEQAAAADLIVVGRSRTWA